jgi:hypothetical protein
LFGTDICRDAFHDDIWILSLKSRLLKAQQNTVITDCRFPNECDAICALGGTILRVHRRSLPPWVNDIRHEIASNPDWFDACMDYGLKHSIHLSEWMSFACKEHVVISNNGTLDDLYRSIETTLITAYTR